MKKLRPTTIVRCSNNLLRLAKAITGMRTNRKAIDFVIVDWLRHVCGDMDDPQNYGIDLNNFFAAKNQIEERRRTNEINKRRKLKADEDIEIG